MSAPFPIAIPTSACVRAGASFNLASIGRQIVGDELYGRKSELIDRQALHAEGLTFSVPSDSTKITVTAPLPKDMKRLAELAGYITE